MTQEQNSKTEELNSRQDTESSSVGGINLPSACRIDYDDAGNLDDVAISGVEMFRLEYMDDKTVWIRLCMKDGPIDHVFWLTSRGKIKGSYEEDDSECEFLRRTAPTSGDRSGSQQAQREIEIQSTALEIGGSPTVTDGETA